MLALFFRIWEREADLLSSNRSNFYIRMSAYFLITIKVGHNQSLSASVIYFVIAPRLALIEKEKSDFFGLCYSLDPPPVLS